MCAFVCLPCELLLLFWRLGRGGVRYLFKVAVLAGALLCVLVVYDVQRSFSVFQLEAFDLRLQLVQLLLQVLALLHVLHPKHRQIAGRGGSLVDFIRQH